MKECAQPAALAQSCTLRKAACSLHYSKSQHGRAVIAGQYTYKYIHMASCLAALTSAPSSAVVACLPTASDEAESVARARSNAQKAIDKADQARAAAEQTASDAAQARSAAAEAAKLAGERAREPQLSISVGITHMSHCVTSKESASNDSCTNRAVH